ncbi:MAG TPA: 5,6-dimethylbenzimidazole synthase [Blastocatellia bacterium]|nr:5,6-dimethylbenzimidazole synthase [Blastocatellia bacterium]
MAERSDNLRTDFTEEEKRGVYRAIYERRDVRSQFLPDPIPESIIARLLSAAHHAASVGFMQPWDFILIDDLSVRTQIKEIFERENNRAVSNYQGDRADLYKSLKLEGILESAINLCVTCDRARGGPNVLGRNTIIETDLFSACLAVQNLWLAARAEGIGVGWVSIVDQSELSTLLKLPDNVYPLAYLCLGYVSEFLPSPELEIKNWRSRVPLRDLIHINSWSDRELPQALVSAIDQIEES